MSPAAATDFGLISRLEAHSVIAWPACVCERLEDGWVLRATPGLDRGRSNHALPPCRRLTAAEAAAAIARVESFAASNGIAPGIQVSPLELHGELLDRLAARGWEVGSPVLVMAGDAASIAARGDALELEFADHADAAWLDAWGRCEEARDIESHVETVFALLDGQARFGRFGRDAVGIVVESDGLAGLFCLAVAPRARRRGLGSALVRGLLAGCAPGTVTYLQVMEHNTPAVAMYDRLAFRTAYRYRHCAKPA